MGAKNEVISGAYLGSVYAAFTDHLYNGNSNLYINNDNIRGYKVLESFNNGKTVGNMATRAAVGAVIAGPAGALIGGATTKDQEIYRVQIYWTNGQESIIEMDGKRYNYLIQNVPNRYTPTSKATAYSSNINQAAVSQPTKTITINPNATPETLKKRIEMFLEEKDFKSAEAYISHLLDMTPNDSEIYKLSICCDLHYSVKDLDDENFVLKHYKDIGPLNSFYRFTQYGGDLLPNLDKSTENLRNIIEKKLLESKFDEVKDYCSVFEWSQKNKTTIAYTSFYLLKAINKCSTDEDLINKGLCSENYKDLFEIIYDSTDTEFVEYVKKVDSKASTVYNENFILNNEVQNATKDLADFLLLSKNNKDKKYDYSKLEKDLDYISLMLNSLYRTIDTKIQKSASKIIEDLELTINNAKKHNEDVDKEEQILKEKAKARDTKIKKIMPFVLVAIVVFVIGSIVANKMAIKSNYQKATEAYNAGDYSLAIELFSKNEDYSDSKEMINICYYDMAVESYNNKEYIQANEYFELSGNYGDSKTYQNSFKMMAAFINEGDGIRFGDYHGELSWTVIEKNENTMTLQCNYIVDCKPFDENGDTDDWDNCSLNTWLNDEFIKEAFTADDKEYYLSNIVGKITVPSEKGKSLSEGKILQYAIDNGLKKYGKYYSWWLQNSSKSIIDTEPHALIKGGGYTPSVHVYESWGVWPMMTLSIK